MVQCAACGKFMNTKEGVTCPKCQSRSHNDCVRVPAGVTVAESWRCGDCQSRTPKGRDPSTPIRGMQDSYLSPLPTHGDAAARAPAAATDAPGRVNIDIVRALREEMLSEFNKMQSIMNSEFKSSKEDRSAFIDEIRELKKEISVMRSCFNERMDAFDARLLALETARASEPKTVEVSGLEQALCEMKTQLNDREQEYLLNDVVITGLPEIQGENPEHWASLLGSKMGMELDERDIVFAERDGPIRRPQDNSQPRARRIIVRFARRASRDSYLQATRVRRGMTTADLGIEGAPARIYVNERLTKLNGQLFAKAREECRSRVWKYCWSKEGRIYVRKEHGAPYSRIRHQQDLDRIFLIGSV